jgi:hypothetical protein
MADSTDFRVDKADDSGMFRGVFLAKVRAESERMMIRLRNREYRFTVQSTVGAGCIFFTRFDTSMRGERERRAGQATISLARHSRARIVGLPSPHHATRPLASEEMPPHLVMQTREKHSIQHVPEAAFGARIGAIEGKWPRFPAKPDHRAPFLHHCVFFGHEHWNFSIHMTVT